MLVFDGSFGSYDLRQLVVDHINYNKNVYIDSIEGGFSKSNVIMQGISFNQRPTSKAGRIPRAILDRGEFT